MPFDRPTLRTLYERLRTDFAAVAAASLTRRDDLLAAAAKIAGGWHSLYGRLAWAERQMHVLTCDPDRVWLFAGEAGLPRREASAATYPITGTGTSASVMPAGTRWVSVDGLVYETTAEATIVAGEFSVDVTAEDVGADYNLPEGATLSLESPVAGFDPEATIVAGGTDGADQEDIEDWRSRVHEWRRQTNDENYVAWALTVSGVTRAWQFPRHMGPGTVGVAFVRDADGTGSAILPDAGEIAEVEAAIEAVMPPTVDLYVFAPIDVPVDIELSITPDTPTIRAAVEAALGDYFARLDIGQTVYLSQLSEVVSQVPDEVSHTLAAPAADVTVASTELPILGVITWP